MSATAALPPSERRPALHKKIDELPDEDLAVVERLLSEMEMDRLWRELREGFASDWADGKYDRLDDIIREVRADLNRSAA